MAWWSIKMVGWCPAQAWPGNLSLQSMVQTKHLMSMHESFYEEDELICMRLPAQGWSYSWSFSICMMRSRVLCPGHQTRFYCALATAHNLPYCLSNLNGKPSTEPSFEATSHLVLSRGGIKTSSGVTSCSQGPAGAAQEAANNLYIFLNLSWTSTSLWHLIRKGNQ